MAIWLTSDTHFGHQNIIRFCNRPFADHKEMDEAIIANWNAVVHPTDQVYHLGDFAYRCSKEYIKTILDRLHGVLTIIPGSHDEIKQMKPYKHYFGLPLLEVVLEGHRVVLCHYPLEAWHWSYRHVKHFHGHTHGRLERKSGRLDVGVDSFGFTPVRLDIAVEKADVF